MFQSKDMIIIWISHTQGIKCRNALLNIPLSAQFLKYTKETNCRRTNYKYIYNLGFIIY